tara:strand:- start:1154 stop:1336 length:183 start_codon:yes stop_codon:yes gene_type:complete
MNKMRYKIREIVNEENWSGDFPTKDNVGDIFGFKNKDELIGWLIEYVNWTSNYWNLEMIE